MSLSCFDTSKMKPSGIISAIYIASATRKVLSSLVYPEHHFPVLAERKESFMARDDAKECGPGIGSCDPGSCCSGSGYCGTGG